MGAKLVQEVANKTNEIAVMVQQLQLYYTSNDSRRIEERNKWC